MKTCHILFIFVFLAIGTLADGSTLSTKIGNLGYSSNSLEHEGFIYGLHFDYPWTDKGIQGEVGLTKNDYKDGSAKVRKYNLALSYYDNLLENLALRLGGHFISAGDFPINNSISLWAGMKFHRKPSWYVGNDLYVSYYPNYLPSAINVIQFTPFLGYHSINIGKKRGLQLLAKGYFMQRVVGGGNNSGHFETYQSLDFEADYNDHGFLADLSFWFGRKSFAVRDNGFFIDNLSEVFIRGYGVSIGHRIFDSQHTVRVSFNEDQFEGAFGNSTGDRSILLICFDFSL